jgi:hypothetical protein
MRKLQTMKDLKHYLTVHAYLARINQELKKYGKFVAIYVSIFTMLMKNVKVVSL